MNITVYMHSLGCAKNLVDSQLMCGVLKKENFLLVGDPADADVIVVNTCGFIESAKIESIQTILELAQYKELGRCRALLAVGCMAEKYGGEMMDSMPELDGVMGSGEYQNIDALIRSKLGLKATSVSVRCDNIYMERDRCDDGAMAYIKIAEGCDNHCSFCLIPQLRGPYKSRSIPNILEEAELLLGQGVKEIVLLAQDTTYYGMDIYGKPSLARLLKELAKMPFAMIRILYAYPGGITEELADVMANSPNICKYLDMPVQHGVNKVLSAMNRPDTAQGIWDKVSMLRNKIPDIVLRTTLMVGFPGETESDFNGLLEFMDKIRFDWVGAFPYYREEDTVAAEMPEQLEGSIKQERLDALMKKAAAVTAEKLKSYIGKTLQVLVTESAADIRGYGWWAGRSQYQAPEVDGLIFFPAENVQIGDMVSVKITDSETYDLIGEKK